MRLRAFASRSRSRWKRRLLRAGIGLVLLASACTALPILALRWIPPLTSAFMLRERWPWGPCDAIEYAWVGRREIAPAVFVAVVAAEDQRFADHAGFDFDAIGDALEERGRNGRSRGASTISQQVAKNLFLWPGKSWLRKAAEAWLTVWIEALWPKPRILEVYVNVAQFGPCTFGVGAAAERFFRTTPGRLGRDQAALLAAVLPNPVERRVEAPSPRVRARAAWIRRQARQIARSDRTGLESSH
jgi:monofunctional biosynthetic peptidoglycan transglycosylase